MSFLGSSFISRTKTGNHLLPNLGALAQRLGTGAFLGSTQLQAVHEAQPQLAISDAEIQDLPDLLKDNFFLQKSKYMHRLMLKNAGLIKMPNLLEVVHVDNHDYNGEFHTKAGQDFFNHQIPQYLIPEGLDSSLDSFVENLIAGKYPRKIAFKPDGKAEAKGLIKVTKDASTIKLDILNHQELDANDLDDTSTNILSYCLQAGLNVKHKGKVSYQTLCSS